VFLKAAIAGGHPFNKNDRHFSAEGHVLFAKFLTDTELAQASIDYYKQPHLSIFGRPAFPSSALRLTGLRAASLILLMRLTCAFALLLGVGSVAGADNDPAKYPVALNSDFEFRKAKIYTLSQNPYLTGQKTPGSADTSKKGGLSRSKSVDQEASLIFERSYRLQGAVTALDQRQRFGQYFDFFWRAKRPSDVIVRFEYKQEKLKAFVQAKEQTYQNVNGTNRSEFRVVGDEYFDDGGVLAWRCLLIEHGRIVAEKRSFLWD
jgi:hypothetical protein